MAALVKQDCVVEEPKYTCFKKLLDAYQLKDDKYLEHLDKDVFTLTQPKQSGIQKVIWKTVIYVVVVFKMFIRLPHYVLKKMVK